MSPSRRLALVAAALYAVTWVTSVAAVPLYGGSAQNATAALAGRTSVLTAALLEIVLAVAVVGTAIALHPLLREHGPGSALGYAALRTLEASVILVGVVAILPVVARPSTTQAPGLGDGIGQALHLLHDWTFLVGPGLVNPVNAVVLASLLLRRRLVARWIPLLGIAGAVIVAAMNAVVMFGLASPQPLLAVPLFCWEISLAGWLALRGIPAPGPREAADGLLAQGVTS